ncbi:MAG: prepilin-type N-terminal cleavage/methylation domain-containing protein [Firmicutes bacterium]|nr:prepilin-type N-terminal cleavage/methylation domain-containing protein [Bacillota bacterium]
MRRKKKGFSLIELLMVIVLTALIATICYIVTFNIVKNTKKEIAVGNVKTLSKIVKDAIKIDKVSDKKLVDDAFFIIKNNKEYYINKNGTTIPTNYFQYEGKPCKNCIIKIKSGKNISIISEDEDYDIKKDYDSNEVHINSLIISREITSLYNELDLFKEIYLSHNSVNELKRFIFENGYIYEIHNDGSKEQVFKINNYHIKGKIVIYKSLKFEYTIEPSNNEIITINDKGGFNRVKNVNNKYSDSVLSLYEEIKFSALRYIENNTISSEAYFEFDNGSIHKVDEYGNKIIDNTISMNSNITGSGELRINSSNQYQIIIYDGIYNIQNKYGNDLLNKEKQTFTSDVRTLFKNLGRLELLAEKYSNNVTSSDYLPSKSDWLVFYYIRQLKYKSSNWDTVSSSDNAFVTYVNNNGSYLKDYFTKKNTFSINGNNIDLKHMAAVMASRMYQTASGSYGLLNQITVDSIASWAGDLQTFMVDNLLPTVTDKTINGYKKATLEMLGNSNTNFSMDDIYADTDAWIIYYNLSKNTNLTIKQAFEAFYSGESARSYKNRFTSFKNTVLNNSNGTKSAFSNLVYKFTKQNYEVDLILFTYTEKWPLYGSSTITSAMSQGVRNGFTEWIYNQIEKE